VCVGRCSGSKRRLSLENPPFGGPHAAAVAAATLSLLHDPAQGGNTRRLVPAFLSCTVLSMIPFPQPRRLRLYDKPQRAEPDGSHDPERRCSRLRRRCMDLRGEGSPQAVRSLLVGISQGVIGTRSGSASATLLGLVLGRPLGLLPWHSPAWAACRLLVPPSPLAQSMSTCTPLPLLVSACSHTVPRTGQ
jgi:hypothetical protein